MPPYTQTNRPLQVKTPLGDNVLLVTGFRGSEQLSTLFSFELNLIAENSTTIDFSRLISHRFPLAEAVEALQLAANPRPDSLKILIMPGSNWGSA